MCMLINLTNDLKENKAIIVSIDEKVPDGYISIAGAFIDGRDVEIAIPNKLMGNKSLFNNLARQAQNCLVNSKVKYI